VIYAADLGGLLKRSLGNKVCQVNIQRIIDMLPIDPSVSGMEGVVFSAKDIQGIYMKKIPEALANAHKDVCVMYVFNNDKHSSPNLGDNFKKRKVKTLTTDLVSEAVTEMLGEHELREGSLQYSQDAVNLHNADKYSVPKIKQDVSKVELSEEKPPAQVVEIPKVSESLNTLLDIPPLSTPSEDTTPSEIEDKIQTISSFNDWDLFKKAAEKDAVTRELIQENAEFQSLLTMLDLFDKKIGETYLNRNLSAEQRFEQIRSLGLSKSAVQAKVNSAYVQKIQAIFDKITTSAVNMVEEKIDRVQSGLASLRISKDTYLTDCFNIKELSDKRLNVQLDLMQIIRELINLYKVMDGTVSEEIDSFDRDLPTSNVVISTLMAPVKSVFIPKNTSGLATLLMASLQNNRIKLSALQDKVEILIQVIFECFEADNEILEYQQKVIDILKANRVEDFVVRDSLIKSTLRIFVGHPDTGTTATALMYAGITSRKNNTLVIDFSRNSKLQSYGVPVTDFDTLITSHIEKSLCFTTYKNSDTFDPEAIAIVIDELQRRAGYYSCIIAISDDTQPKVLNQLGDHALTVTYVSNCTDTSIDAMRKVITNHSSENIARRLALIDPPIPVLNLVAQFEIDMLTTKVMTIPYSSHIRQSALLHTPPYDNEETRLLYEEALR
jgi:hypothetical protein